jgi:hypothetical protein
VPKHSPPKSRRHRLAISVRTLMIIVLLVGGPPWWWLNQHRRRQEAVAAIKRLDSSIVVDSVLTNRTWVPRRPSWVMRSIREIFGDGPFEEVNIEVFGSSTKITNDSPLVLLALLGMSG